MLRFSLICVLFVGIVAPVSRAADPDQLKRFLQSKSCSGCDLTKANFAQMNLAGANLSGAKLNGANLNGASLLDANLSFADLTGADLRYADLRRAKMDGANWRKAIICNTTMPDGKTSYLTC